MSLWLLAADGGASMPVGEVRELFVIHRTADKDRQARLMHPHYHVCASKTADRTGPYRVLARIPDDGTDAAEDAALAALEELTMLLADDSTDGVLRWADAWMLQVPADPDAVTES
jgi:hypothetical protein